MEGGRHRKRGLTEKEETQTENEEAQTQRNGRQTNSGETEERDGEMVETDRQKEAQTRTDMEGGRQAGQRERQTVKDSQGLFFIFTTVLSEWEFSHEKFGLLSRGKASCDRVALPNLRCMLCVLVFP